MTRARVAFVSLSTLATGGIETHLLQLMAGLRDEFAFTAIGTLAEPFSAQAAALGAELVHLPPGGRFDPGMILRLRSAFRRGRFALIHTHDTRGGLLGRIAAKLARIPALHTAHTPSFFLPTTPRSIALYRTFERILNAHFSAGVIFVSPTIRRIYIEGRLISPGKAHLISNGLEREWFETGPAGAREPGPVTFLYIGRLAPEKGMDNLIGGFARIAAALPSARLRMIGDGPLRDDILRQIERAGLRGRVELPGRLDRGKLRQALQAADIFVMPSRFESLSFTILEAMACGIPCIATDVGGNRDLIVPGRTGLLVPSADPAALGEAMLQLAQSAPLRILFGEAARLRAQDFPLENMLEQTRQVYRRLCGLAGSPDPRA